LRRFACLLIAFLLVSDAALRADEQQQARAIIGRAIKAHGGVERLTQFPAQSWEETGIYYGLGESTAYKASIAAHYPKRVKIDVENQFIAVVNGDHGWMTVQGKTRDLSKDSLNDRLDEQYADWVTTLLPLRDRKFKLALHDDALVETRPAAGVHVSWGDHRGLNLYFDKVSGLLVKSEQRVKSQEQQGQEVMQEIILLDFQDVQGIKFPRKTLTRRNGKQFLETTRTELKRLEKLDDSLFVRP
jgi:hypothetical protein